MVAAFPPLLSDQPPDLAKRAEFGDRFHYWRGYSGQRYLFSVVPSESLADFRSVVAILAVNAGGGRLAIRAITVLDDRGQPCGGGRSWPAVAPAGSQVLVHLLAASHGNRLRIVDDIVGASAVRLAA